MFGRVIKWAGNILLGLILVAMIVLVFFTVTSKLSEDGTSAFGNYKMMVVLSGSMSPAFEAGDVIIVSGENQKSEYQKGDVITFRDPEDTKRIVTHRIIEVINAESGILYRTQGDANKTPDLKPVPAANVIGQQQSHIPYLGRLVEFAKTKQGLVWLIIVPGILVIISELRNMAKAVTEEIERKKREAVAKPWAEDSSE